MVPPLDGLRWMIPTARFSLPMSTTRIVRSTPGWRLTVLTSSSVMYVAAFGVCADAPGDNAATATTTPIDFSIGSSPRRTGAYYTSGAIIPAPNSDKVSQGKDVNHVASRLSIRPRLRGRLARSWRRRDSDRRATGRRPIVGGTVDEKR